MKRAIAYIALLATGGIAMAATPAQASFVDDYLAGKHFCGQNFPSPNELVTVNRGLLLGKAPADWTDQDMVSFQDALKRCVQVARARGVQVDLGGTNFDTLGTYDYNALLNAIAQAKAERSVQEEEGGASKRFAAQEQKRALESAAHDRQIAEENSRQAEADRVLATQEAKEKMAKDQADTLAAHARREAAMVRRKALAMEAEAFKASAEADQAEAAERQAAAVAAEQRTASKRASEAKTASASKEAMARGAEARAPAQIGSATPKSALPDSCEVSYDAYKRLHDGISYNSAAETLGCYGKEMSRDTMAGQTTVMYGWEGAAQGANMSAMFQNDRLTNKAQFGLE